MPGLNPKQEDIDQFVAITQATPAEAERFLSDGVTLEGAIEDYFAAQTAGGTQDADMADEDDLDAALAASAAEAAPTGGARTLSGAPAGELPPEWANRGGRITTIGAMNAADDDDEDVRRGNELYTGGERSGLAVQNPDQGRRPGHAGLVNDILQQARDAGPLEDEPAAPSAHRWGGGHTLGSEDTPSVPVGRSGARGMPGAFGATGDDDEDDEEEEEAVERRLIFWADGFSIEDGELYRYDDPQNQMLLNMIKAGRAPASLWNVAFNQPVQVVVEQRTNENYTPPPKAPMKAFSGGGNRLGSADDDAGAGSSSAAAAAAAPPAPPASKPAELNVDPSKPTTSIQVRLGDGTRLVARVNLDHTVADIRGFVTASRPDHRQFVLQTTFPSRELPDSETVEEAKLQNAVVVQRFV